MDVLKNSITTVPSELPQPQVDVNLALIEVSLEVPSRISRNYTSATYRMDTVN